MKYITHTGFIVSTMLCLGSNITAQEKEWKTVTTDGGKITVKYCISQQTDERGKKITTIEDHTRIVDSLGMNNCISLMKNISRHKEFTGDCISEMVKAVSDSECLIYYYSDNPWPIANSDCVALMTFAENKAENTAVFTLTAEPSGYKKVSVNRMIRYNVTYSFKDLGNGQVEITVTGKTSPPVKVPLFIIKLAFPEAPASALRKFVKLLKQEKNEHK
jgi:hypothetical protein